MFLNLSLFFVACHVRNAKINDYQEVTVLIEQLGENDSLLFKKFEREEKIHVNFLQLPKGKMIQYLKEKRYQTSVDVILFDSYLSIVEARSLGLLAEIESKKLEEQVDPVYRSEEMKWIALSKTPIVFIYNKNFLKKDTIEYYSQLISPIWQNRLAFQDKNDKTLRVFDEVNKFLLKENASDFLRKFYKQSVIPKEGDDFMQIKRIQNGDASLAMVQLASLVKFYAKNEQYKKVILPIFPNQRKKGAYISITGAAVYRFTGDYENANKVLDFLYSKRAQYQYAAGRFEIPILNEVASCHEVKQFGKFRARFYHERFKFKKRP